MGSMETDIAEVPGPPPASPEAPSASPLSAAHVWGKAGWRKQFLAVYQRTGQLYVSAEAIGVSWSKVERTMQQDANFRNAVEVRRQRYADRLEGQFDNMFFHPTRPNVIAGIVLAKKHRPQDFVERHQGVTMNVQALATPEQAHELLRVMLRDATPETQAQLALPPPESPE